MDVRGDYKPRNIFVVTRSRSIAGIYELAFYVFIFADCKLLNPPSNGSLSANVTAFATNVTVSCDAGFTLSGQEHLNCKADGQWDGLVGECWKGNII